MNCSSAVLLNVFPCLNVVDLLRVARVCKKWYAYARSNLMWTRHMRRVVDAFPELERLFKGHWTVTIPKDNTAIAVKELNPRGIWRVFARQLLQFYHPRNQMSRRIKPVILWCMLSASPYYTGNECHIAPVFEAHRHYCLGAKFKCVILWTLTFVCTKCHDVIIPETVRLRQWGGRLCLVGTYCSSNVALLAKEFNEKIIERFFAFLEPQLA
jgi:hypothetical protein